MRSRFDYIIALVFVVSIIVPIMVSSSQSYIVQYGDDIAMIRWAQLHSHDVLSVFTDEVGGTGYRPMMHLWFLVGYNLWGNNPFYYNLLNGILFSLSMVFLYLLGKLLHSRGAGVVAVLLYLFLDGSFIMVSKLNFIAFSGEILFITTGLYYSIKYFKTKDRTSMYLAIVLCILAFLSKEPSLLIIPIASLAYLYFNRMLNKNHIIFIIPFIYMMLVLFVLAPEVGAERGADLFERIRTNVVFYFNTEIETQFKTPVLLVISLLIAFYYLIINKMRDIIALCLVWFIVGILPFLVTRQPVQPTYLIEANLGIVLIIGIVVASQTKNNLFLGLVVIGLLFQAVYVPGQISNMMNHNYVVSNNQKTFLETVNALESIQTKSIFYISDNTRQKYGYQIGADAFQDYLCIRDMCDIKVTTDYNLSKYIILPSTLDVSIFQKEYPNERLKIFYQVNNSNNYGFILEK